MSVHPLFRNVHHSKVQHFQKAVIRRENGLGLGHLPQLAVNSLEAVVNLMTPTKPRCPHLGCALKYNPAEHSWDCPCHGSRFTSDGKLIDNPSTGDIKV